MHITRVLRKQMTPWEIRLWSVLRNRKVNNLKFRRQYKIGTYVVDFCCLELKLVIELDGGHHTTQLVHQNDVERQKFIENNGYTVLRFWNNEINNNLEGVVQKILEYSLPHPSPLRSRRGGNK